LRHYKLVAAVGIINTKLVRALCAIIVRNEVAYCLPPHIFRPVYMFVKLVAPEPAQYAVKT
jgi:hypothetical protein